MTTERCVHVEVADLAFKRSDNDHKKDVEDEKNGEQKEDVWNFFFSSIQSSPHGV